MTIATILIAYTSAVVLSNQASGQGSLEKEFGTKFAQQVGVGLGKPGQANASALQEITHDIKAQVGKVCACFTNGGCPSGPKTCTFNR